jgi:hypothetical protein
MIDVQFGEPQFRIREEAGRPAIFDTIRKSWVALTEEEWVRQNLIRYLVESLQYPASLVAVEKAILVNGLSKRFDILIYDRQHAPWMLIECKAPQVPLSGEVLQQLLRYHITVPVPYLVLSNGTQTLGWQKTGGTLQPLQALPPHEG